MQADKYVLHLLADFDDATRRSYESFAFHPGTFLLVALLLFGLLTRMLPRPRGSDEGHGDAAQSPVSLLYRHDARLDLLRLARAARSSGRAIHLPGCWSCPACFWVPLLDAESPSAYFQVLNSVSQAVAPIAPFMIEELAEHRKDVTLPAESAFSLRWQSPVRPAVRATVVRADS